MNLGIALGALGERESGTARLEEAVAAFRAALEECTRDRVPLQWATTQTNLGAALGRLGRAGERDGAAGGGGRGLSRGAGGKTRDRVPLQWAMTQSNLAEALAAIAARVPDTGRKMVLSEALAAVDSALSLFREAGTEPYIQEAERIRSTILTAPEQTTTP